MTLYAVEDSRSVRAGRAREPWFWTDSLSWSKKGAIDRLCAFVSVFPEYQGKTRGQQLRIARREGLRVIRVRLEAVA